MDKKFRTTHIITFKGKEIPVISCDTPGPIYTQPEWETYSIADWEMNDDGSLTFQGEPGEASYRKA